MDEEPYKFREWNFDFKNKFPQFGCVLQVLNDTCSNGKPWKTQMSKKFHFDKRYSKVMPIEWSHAAKKDTVFP